MTENTLLQAPPLDAEAGQSRKPLIILGGVAGALALGAAGFFLLHGGGGSETTAFAPVPHGVVKNVVHPSKVTRVAAKPAVKKLPVVSLARLGRDPFNPLYVVPVAPPATTAPSTTTPASTTVTPGTTTATAPYALQLVSISGPASSDKVFVFKYGTTSKTVVAAQKFGKYGELVTLSFIKNSKGTPIAALIQVGDDDPKTIRIGEKLTVQ